MPRLTIGKRIGSGAFSTVHIAEYAGEQVAGAYHPSQFSFKNGAHERLIVKRIRKTKDFSGSNRVLESSAWYWNRDYFFRGLDEEEWELLKSPTLEQVVSSGIGKQPSSRERRPTLHQKSWWRVCAKRPGSLWDCSDLDNEQSQPFQGDDLASLEASIKRGCDLSSTWWDDITESAPLPSMGFENASLNQSDDIRAEDDVNGPSIDDTYLSGT
ncbi:hypothetical protein R3P38DRAFT_2815837 [Favolaschia claudopus]|uniref:Uncharacterized protein n=1 Tax=Favolaschia claudopus TaxID=2862362 RepID=A0AAV9Z0G5_9AGAR